jgi:hypothetical protein
MRDEVRVGKAAARQGECASRGEKVKSFLAPEGRAIISMGRSPMNYEIKYKLKR